MHVSGFSRDYDSVLLMFDVLQRLGHGKVSTFNQRLSSQKVQYLAQASGISPQYRYSLYIRGPYSPDLAHDLFQINSNKTTVTPERFIPETLEYRLGELKTFISGKTPRQLELTATLHWLLHVADFNDLEAEIKLTAIKHTTDSEVTETVHSVKKICKI